MIELKFFWAAMVVYGMAASIGIIGLVFRRRLERALLPAMLIGLALHAIAIGLRWERLGHGPFVTLFEILSSNLWSMTLAFALACWRLPSIQPSAAAIMPILLMMMAWLLTSSPAEGHLPPTYHTVWLYIHVAFGKIFFGAVLIAVGISSVILARTSTFGVGRFSRMPSDESLAELAFRCLAVGFVFESLMLIVGAIWAQDAWGRYWAWDPLETWAFLTWLLLALTLHARFTFTLTPRIGSLLVVAVFVVAFLTFFGVPFVSTTPHQGAV
jgi:ABC-type transport system involved in cytochrome c biogenesis permease subunit